VDWCGSYDAENVSYNSFLPFFLLFFLSKNTSRLSFSVEERKLDSLGLI